MSILKKSKTARIVTGVIGFTMALSLFVGVGTASALSQDAIDLLELLIAVGIVPADKVEQARALIDGGSVTPPPSTGFVFTRNLQVGSRGEDVRQLQIVLNQNSATRLAASGAGSPGNETTYFGPITRSAVIKFQDMHAAEVLTPVGLTRGTGFVGPSTRAFLNSMGTPTPPPPSGQIDLCVNIEGVQTVIPAGLVRDAGGNCVVGTAPPVLPPPATGNGNLTVSSGAQPANSLAPASAARVPFTTVVLTAGSADVTVKRVVTQRTNLAVDGNFSGIVLLDSDGTQLGIARTLNSDHQARVGEEFTIPANTSKTVTVAGNIAASGTANSGEIASLDVIGVETTGGTVSGSFPIKGASHTINTTLSIGTVTVARGSLDPNNSVTKKIGTTGYIFSSLKVTAGSNEDIRLNSVRWNQASSASSEDIANIVTMVDGVEYPTTISSDGKYYVSKFPGGILINKGLSKEISVRGDIVDGSSRTVAFKFLKKEDVNLTGELYGYGITPPTSGTGIDSGSTWFGSSNVTISAGTITVSNAPTVPADNIGRNAANQVLGGFDVDVIGEAISVGKITFTVATTGTASAGSAELTSVTIVDENGVIVAGPEDDDAAGTSIIFNNEVTFPVGKHTYRILGKVGSAFGANGTVILKLTPSSQLETVVGENTAETITPSPSTQFSMNTQTVRTATVKVSVSPTPVSQNIVAGTAQYTGANIVFDAINSGEDVRFNSFPLEFSTANTATDHTSCQLYDENDVSLNSNNKVDPSAQASSTLFTFDNAFIVPRGTAATLTLKCDLKSGSSGTFAWGYDSSASPSATGNPSGSDATITENDSAGQLMTISTGGSLSVTLDSSSPIYALGADGTTGNTVSVLRVRADDEDIRLTDLGLQLTTSGAGASTSPQDVTGVTIWDGSTLVGRAAFTAGNYAASSTIGTCSGCSQLIIPRDTDKLLTVKADFAQQGTNKAGSPGNLVRVDWDNASADATQGIGLGSGTTIYRTNGSDTSSNGVRVVAAYPVLERVNLDSTKLISGTPDLFRFKVTAVGGQVGIYSVTYRIATSSATSKSGMIVNTNVYAFTNSDFTGPVSGLGQSDGALNATANAGSAWASDSTDLEIVANDGSNNTTVVIPEGATRYFAIRGTVSTAGTTYSVSTQLQGDAAFNNVPGVTGGVVGPYKIGNSTTGATSTYLSSTTPIAAAGHDDFIWRPFSTTTVNNANANDYLNGYGVPGLNTNNSSAQVLTQ